MNIREDIRIVFNVYWFARIRWGSVGATVSDYIQLIFN